VFRVLAPCRDSLASCPAGLHTKHTAQPETAARQRGRDGRGQGKVRWSPKSQPPLQMSHLHSDTERSAQLFSSPVYMGQTAPARAPTAAEQTRHGGMWCPGGQQPQGSGQHSEPWRCPRASRQPRGRRGALQRLRERTDHTTDTQPNK